jgi:hypothetical protein
MQALQKNKDWEEQHQPAAWRLLSICACKSSTYESTGDSRNAGLWLAQPQHAAAEAECDAPHLCKAVK